VIAVGSCATSGGVFQGCYNCLGGIDQVVPVDMYIPGCPPRPEAIIDGILKLLQKWKATLGQPERAPLPADDREAARPLLENGRLY
jgi:NADH:ubiquinone oxidoreductase subunit B-like Fe-S oxidoreductase